MRKSFFAMITCLQLKPFFGRVFHFLYYCNVLVFRGDLDAQEREMVESGQLPMIVIAETVDQLNERVPARAKDMLLLEQELNVNYRFYRYKDGMWVKK